MRQLFVLISILFLFLGCDKSNPKTEECSLLSELKIVDQEEAFLTCEHFEIYIFDNQLYSLCSNCVVDKFALPINCDGESLCTIDDSTTNDCVSNFYNKASFQFYMIAQ